MPERILIWHFGPPGVPERVLIRIPNAFWAAWWARTRFDLDSQGIFKPPGVPERVLIRIPKLFWAAWCARTRFDLDSQCILGFLVCQNAFSLGFPKHFGQPGVPESVLIWIPKAFWAAWCARARFDLDSQGILDALCARTRFNLDFQCIFGQLGVPERVFDLDSQGILGRLLCQNVF